MAEINSKGFQELVREFDESGKYADPLSGQEELKLAFDKLKLTVESLSLQNKSLAQNIELRKVYADLIFTLVCLWLTLVLIIIIACGKGNLTLSDTVISLLIGTTTTNVCGFLLFVVKYLFNVENPKKDAKTNSKDNKKNNKILKKIANLTNAS